MRYLLILLMATSPLVLAEEKKEDSNKDTARIEILLRQQRELEADELLLVAKKNQKEGNFEDAIRDYKKSIDLYRKSSSSDKRIIRKVTISRMLLSSTYKTYAVAIIKEAEKNSSVELFEKAKSILNEAKKTNDLIPR